MAQGFIKINGIDEFITELKDSLLQSEDLAIEQLAYIGERAVKIARTKGSYTDRTGNLRSSIGYMILMDGQPVVVGDPRTYPGDPRYQNVPKVGADNAQKLLRELSAKYPKGLSLIVCAGMEYASDVELRHGKDVLTSAELLAEQLVQKLISKKT